MRFSKSTLSAFALSTLVVVGYPGAASATGTGGTATITGGSLGLTAPATVAFAATLNGVDQTVNTSQLLDVHDATGTGSGWNVTLTTTTFTSTSPDATLPTSAVTDTGATNAADTNTAATLATNDVSYSALVIPAGTSAPTPVKIFTAGSGSGMGGQTSTHTMQLAIPARTIAGSYTSIWTYSIVSAP